MSWTPMNALGAAEKMIMDTCVERNQLASLLGEFVVRVDNGSELEIKEMSRRAEDLIEKLGMTVKIPFAEGRLKATLDSQATSRV